ncbi:CHAT domain-containing protein [Actinomadura sp. KC345]|uniref:CHAT domain-containing protein n=1 Tax=Actinomadura sp. KC345 TaxID=2530371 RepID=UPI0014043DB0|nr:CHAT domain-containing protein [Actinomadura sp. KC345]
MAQIHLDDDGVHQGIAALALSELLDSPALTAPDLALFLLRVVHGLHPDTVSEVRAAVFGIPFADFVAGYGTTVTMRVISQGVNLARERADLPLLRTVLDWADRLEVRWDAAHRRQFIEARAHALPGDPTCCPRPGEALAESFPDSWTRSQRSAAAIHAAAHARDRGRPALGLALLSQVAEETSEEVRLLAADLHHQAATAGEPIPGPLPFPWGHYTYAALAYASLNMTELARACLVPFAQRVGGLRGADLRDALCAIIVDLPNFDPSGAPELGELLRDLVHSAVWQMAVEHRTVPMGLMLGLHHAVKGQELGSWWRLDGPVALPPHIQHFAARLRDLDGPAAAAASRSNLLDDADADRRPAGRDDAEIAGNLRWRISSLIDTELVRGATPLIDDQHLWAKAHELLDERTVLLTWFLPRFVRGAALLLGVTAQGRTLTVALGEGEGEGEVRHPVADVVEAIREEVQRDPLFADVTPEGARLLESGDLLGGDGSWAEWRAQGKDRLLVWPHGAVHYLPIPLCRVGGRLIADDWTVTTIAGLESLTSPGGFERERRTTVLASSAGGVRYGLHEEPALEEHARRVAGAVGVEAVVGTAATRARLLAELSRSDIVHIAVHGTMDPDAPWLQCLYLSPDIDDDGRVHAYDFLGVDLRGVRLVTLAACESALGRFDRADNVRGIPSALITAGAQAVVGCLWPVRPAPAACFYERGHRMVADQGELLDRTELPLRVRLRSVRHRTPSC